jgi:hypothetical protein
VVSIRQVADREEVWSLVAPAGSLEDRGSGTVNLLVPVTGWRAGPYELEIRDAGSGKPLFRQQFQVGL